MLSFSNSRAEDTSFRLPEILEGAKCPHHSEYRKAEAILSLKLFLFIPKEGRLHLGDFLFRWFSSVGTPGCRNTESRTR